ncbi:MAG: SCP-like extracellular [Gammaproteobacteria bacterium]|nr:SCP-like extracellular [Gammaproteobacteria bacterium]
MIACSQSGPTVQPEQTTARGWATRVRNTSTTVDTRALLEAHNRYRRAVGVAPLEWSSEVAASAQRWADELVATGSFEHSSGPYGENLWSGTAGAFDQQSMVDSWGSEQQDFVSGKAFPKICRRHWSECGHYTQIVWRSSKRLGCGLSRGSGLDYLVCQYDPPGNMQGVKPY